MWTSGTPLIHPAAIKGDFVNTLVAAAAILQRGQGQLESKRHSELLLLLKQFLHEDDDWAFCNSLQVGGQEQERTKAGKRTVALLCYFVDPLI